jgi:hypothetical protein
VTQPRKGAYCRPEIKTLLRDAQPTRAELYDEPDPRKRKQNIRAKEIAVVELVKMYRDHERRGQLNKLNFEVRKFCERLKQGHTGKLPKNKGGRPSNDHLIKDHQHLLIAVKVVEALEAQTGKRKSVTKAIQHVHDTLMIDGKRLIVPISAIRDIYYRSDPEWKRALKAELAWRRLKSESF